MLSSGDLSIFFHLGQPLSKNTMREDKWHKSNSNIHIIMCYLTTMNWSLLFREHNINMLLFLNNVFLLYSHKLIDWIISPRKHCQFLYLKIHIWLNLIFSNYNNIAHGSEHM
jgi:hypothetical protein